MHHKDKVEVKGIGPVLVSTVLLPMKPFLYETCLFWQGDSEVVEVYSAPGKALRGHAGWLDPAKIEDRIDAVRREWEEV